MKLTNVKQVEEFKRVIAGCEGDVVIKSLEGDVFNMKSAMSEYVALGRLLDDHGDELELFASNKADESRIMRFLIELDKDNKDA